MRSRRIDPRKNRIMLRRRTIIPASLLFAGLWTLFGVLSMPSGESALVEPRFAVHPNDLAAGLVLLLPGCATFAWMGRGGRRWLALGTTGLLVAALVATGSRGGLVAGLLGLAVAWTVVGPRGRRALLVLAVACFLAVAALSAAIGGDELHRRARAVLRDHDAEGATWDHLLSGRPEIWRRAGRIVRDLPLFGAGLHGYRELVPDAYPMPPESFYEASRTAGPQVDDSHQLFLELAVVHGLPVTLVLLGLVTTAVLRLLRRLRRGELPASEEALHAGLLGGIVAHLAHGLGDVAAPGAVPFGMAVHLLFWLVIGLGLRETPSRSPSPSHDRASLPRALVLALLAVAALAVVAQIPVAGGPGLLRTETMHRRALQALERNDPAPELAEALRDGPCRSQWWRHLLAHHLPGRGTGTGDGTGEADGAVSSLRALASCDAARIRDLRALAPFDRHRAEAAADVSPGHPDVLLWRAWALRGSPRAPDEARLRRLYDLYLAHRPEDGEIWIEAARGLRRGREHPAWRLAALSQACVHGDPGANACYGAGGLARRMDLPASVALHLLRLSEWAGARALADEIEAAAEKKSTAELTNTVPPPV